MISTKEIILVVDKDEFDALDNAIKSTLKKYKRMIGLNSDTPGAIKKWYEKQFTLLDRVKRELSSEIEKFN